MGAAGETPLSLCAKDGNIEVVKDLLQARAQIETNNVDVVEKPLSRGQDPSDDMVQEDDDLRHHSSSALLRAVKQNAECGFIKELIGASAGLAVTDSDKNTPIHCASRHGNTRVVRLLLTSKANADCCNKDLRTPLHFAAACGSQRIIKMLVDQLADVNREDNLGLTPVQQAADPVTQRQLYSLGGRKGPGRGLAIVMPGDISLTAALALANQSRVHIHANGIRSLPTSLPGSLPTSPPGSVPTSPPGRANKNRLMTRSTGALRPASSKQLKSPLSMSQPLFAKSPPISLSSSAHSAQSHLLGWG